MDNDKEIENAERLARIEILCETMNHRLFGNGQPGELDRMKDDISSLKASRVWVKGIMSTLGFIVGGDSVAHIKGWLK